MSYHTKICYIFLSRCVLLVVDSLDLTIKGNVLSYDLRFAEGHEAGIYMSMELDVSLHHF